MKHRKKSPTCRNCRILYSLADVPPSSRLFKFFALSAWTLLSGAPFFGGMAPALAAPTAVFRSTSGLALAGASAAQQPLREPRAQGWAPKKGSPQNKPKIIQAKWSVFGLPQRQSGLRVLKGSVTRVGGINLCFERAIRRLLTLPRPRHA